MSYSESQSFGSGGAALSRPRESTPIEVVVERLRLALGIGLVLLLVVFAALGDQSAPDSGTDATVSQSQTDTAMEFDGRSKWGGYAR